MYGGKCFFEEGMSFVFWLSFYLGILSLWYRLNGLNSVGREGPFFLPNYQQRICDFLFVAGRGGEDGFSRFLRESLVRIPPFLANA
jgi:hypothetical protein